eukprot:6420033-Pyramimonas_sp.AAC.1
MGTALRGGRNLGAMRVVRLRAVRLHHVRLPALLLGLVAAMERWDGPVQVVVVFALGVAVVLVVPVAL